MRIQACLGLVALALGACGGGEATPPSTPASSGSAEDAKTFSAQVAAGQTLYVANCASCHGGSGEGGANGSKAPRVVGLDKGALPLDPPPGAQLRKTQFHNVADVAGFAVKNMPPGKGGSLSEPSYWAILAFDLHANGVDLPNKLDASSAASVVLHK